MSVKQNLIKFLNPVRKLYNIIYSLVLAAYLGKTIIVLNQIDHNVLNWIFYFFIFSPKGKDIKVFYKLVSTQTMGVKLFWLKEIYSGKITKINKKMKQMKISLEIFSTANTLVDNQTFKDMLELLEKIINDARNPLIHSNYFLGYGNEYEWKLSYSRFYFNKIKNDFDNSTFAIKDAKKYIKTVQEAHQRLTKSYFQLFQEVYPV